MATLFANPRFQPLDAQGDPYPGATLTFYAAGTTTPQAVYTTSALTTPHPSPVTANSAGQFPAIYYDDALQYRAILRDATGVLLWDIDLINSNLTAEEVGRALYTRTTGEISAAITPTNYRFAPGDVRRYGADATGTTSASAAITAALASNTRIYIRDGAYRFNSTVSYGDFQEIICEGATLRAGVNNLTFFTVTTNAYYSVVRNPRFDGFGFSNVTGFDLSNVRLRASIENPVFADMETGLIARNGCFGLQVLNPAATRVPFPIAIIANASAMQIVNPSFDNSAGISGDDSGVGIDVRVGANDNIGVAVYGGFIQGFEVGLRDAGIGTLNYGTYYELCSEADISGISGCRQSRYSDTQHYGPSGPAAIKLRNTDGVTIFNPSMASGSRTALFDVNSTNTNVNWFDPGSNASLNTPTGSLTYVGQITRELVGTFTPVVVGTSTAGTGTYTTQSGKITKNGRQVHVEIEVTWSAHTGSGNISITGIPTTLSGSANECVPGSFTPARTGVCVISGMSWTGPELSVAFSGSGTTITPIQISTSGVISLISIAGAGSIRVSLIYTT